MTVRLIAVDMDGTLLDPDDKVTPATVDAIARAREAGVPVVPVTGRPERLIWNVAAEAGLGPLGVGANGALILDLDVGTVIERTGFGGPAAIALVDTLRRGVPGLAIAADEGDRFVYEPGVLAGLALRSRSERSQSERLEVADIRDCVARGCLKLVARRADLSSRQLAALIAPLLHNEAGDLATVTASDIAWVDIGPPGLSKATGLLAVCRRLGIAMGDVAAIGDHFNDLPMLAAVGLPFAVANAIPEVLAAAARVMPSNADDGVAVFIDEILLTA